MLDYKNLDGFITTISDVDFVSFESKYLTGFDADVTLVPNEQTLHQPGPLLPLWSHQGRLVPGELQTQAPAGLWLLQTPLQDAGTGHRAGVIITTAGKVLMPTRHVSLFPKFFTPLTSQSRRG